MKFKAAMFDFDGTVTEKGHPEISIEMIDALAQLALKMPIAFCTGRNLESFVRRALNKIFDHLSDDIRDDVLKNLYLIAENGSVGYLYNLDNEKFEEFYKVEWPESFVSKEDVKRDLTSRVSPWGELFENAHKAVVVYRTNLYDTIDRDIKEVYKMSASIYEETCKYLEDIGEDYNDYLHVGDSGIGVLVVPANGDKDTGIRRFADYLTDKRGMSFGDDAKEILVIGDRPQKGGNDHYFLSGRFGTPYTVGNFEESMTHLSQVFDENDKLLLHCKGTLHLIKNIV